jgi:hypothetical protein
MTYEFITIFPPYVGEFRTETVIKAYEFVSEPEKFVAEFQTIPAVEVREFVTQIINFYEFVSAQGANVTYEFTTEPNKPIYEFVSATPITSTGLQLRLQSTISEGCKFITIDDVTGDYSSTNTGGYGFPNPLRDSANVYLIWRNNKTGVYSSSVTGGPTWDELPLSGEGVYTFYIVFTEEQASFVDGTDQDYAAYISSLENNLLNASYGKWLFLSDCSLRTCLEEANEKDSNSMLCGGCLEDYLKKSAIYSGILSAMGLKNDALAQAAFDILSGLCGPCNEDTSCAC